MVLVFVVQEDQLGRGKLFSQSARNLQTTNIREVPIYNRHCRHCVAETWHRFSVALGNANDLDIAFPPQNIHQKYGEGEMILDNDDSRQWRRQFFSERRNNGTKSATLLLL